MSSHTLVPFYKIHGCNNHFIVCWDDHANWDLWQERTEPFCNPTHGVGADGLLVCTHADSADFLVMMFNPDGSRMGMCGNGLRCVARYLFLTARIASTKVNLVLETGERVVKARLFNQGREVELDLGTPIFDLAKIPFLSSDHASIRQVIEVEGERLDVFPLSMGNPHCVLFEAVPSDQRVRALGPTIEKHSAFPERCNVGFASIARRDRVLLRVWERGVGETQACGSGACAAVVAGAKLGLLDFEATVSLPGGDLLVRIAPQFERVFLRGPAQEIFEGRMFFEPNI